MKHKLTLLTVAAIATIATVQGVKADETNVPGTATTGIETSGIATSENGSAGTKKNETTEDTEQPTFKDSNEKARSTSNHSNQQGNATEFVKNGGDIQVTNPNVTIEQPEGNGRYTPFKVKYEDIKIPDNIEVNEGDKVTFDLPQEVKFETSYEFDVHNPDNAVVGKATADATANKVTTVFNDYFKSHPLNKSMNLELDASWSDKVVPGKPVNVNFNGTVVTVNVGSEGVIGKDELITKWGSQDKDDPTVINWTARVNYAKRVLNYVKIIDEMSENQKLVDNYFEIKNIESLDPWIDKGSAIDLVKSINKSDHGFTITMDRLDHMIYLYYKTKLVNAVKDSTNPTNKIELKAESDGAVAYQKIQLVGGRGDASGENKPEPTWKIPNDAPKYEKPSININDIPLMPPAPVLDKPELEIPDGPVKPSPEPKADQPKPKEEPKQDKPSTPAPKTETKKETVEVVNPSEIKQDELVEIYSAPAVLPATGSDLGLSLVALGISVATLAFTLKKKEI